MKELELLEQEMRQWRPQPASERLGRRLFGRTELTPVALRRAEFWHWLTPVAACALTVLVAVGSANYRDKGVVTEGGRMVFAGLILNPGSSNGPQMVRLSQMDENVEWNVCPELAPLATVEARRAATNLNGKF
jgi:hypothetical protein